MSMSVSSQDQLTQQDQFLTQLLSECQKQSFAEESTFALWRQKRQQEAATTVAASRMPHRKDEEWRFTDLSPLLEYQYQKSQSFDLSSEALAAFNIPEATTKLVFINGYYSSTLSQTENLPAGVKVGNLGALEAKEQSKVTDYLTQQEGGEELFTALNTAGFDDAAVVWVAKNTEVETPIHLLFLSVGEEKPTLIQPRCLVIAETSSKVNVIEQYASFSAADAASYFNNPVTEVWVEANAQVNHVRLQQEALNSFQIAKTAVTQAQDSRYACYPVSMGGRLSRLDFDVFQTGTQTDTRLYALTLGNGEQLLDTHSAIAFRHPHSSADQLQKNILDDHGRAVFNGKVFVPQNAQLTNASQLNRNLLLSEKAHVDTKPELNITADNVQCAHGATVSQLEADELFYLRSRGLDSQAASNLLINAFAAEIINEISVKSVRDALYSSLENRFLG